MLRINNYVLIVLSCLLLAYAWRNAQLDRYSVKSGVNFILQVVNVFLSLSFILIVMHTKSKSKIVRIAFILSFIIYSVFCYEREPLILLLTVALLYYSKKIKLWQLAICGVFFVFLISYYKAFYVIALGDQEWGSFIDFVSNRSISLAALDPISSFSLLYDYFDKTPFYLSEHKFSYFTSFYDQFLRYVGNEEVLSLGQAASEKYVYSQYGVAYSMILESILNFSIFGPVILVVATKAIYVSLCKKLQHMQKLIDVMFVLFFTTFVRTEFMVMIKMYILPMLLFFFIISLIVKKKYHVGYERNKS